MSELLIKRQQMAEAGIECTPEEVSQLLEMAEQLDELSNLSVRDLSRMMDPNDFRNHLIIDYIVSEYRE